MQNLDERTWAFLRDDRFIKWVTEPNKELNAYWENWMEDHPGEVEYLLKAKEIAKDLGTAEAPANMSPISESAWEGILASIESQEQVVSLPTVTRKKTWYWIAAMIAGAVVIATFFYFYFPRAGKNALTMQNVTRVLLNDSLDRSNQTTENQVLYLVDGSKVTLQPGSSVKHTVFFHKDKREVYLDGNAFFEVAKDSSRPFYVYTKDIVLRVLGTSFNVTTDKDNGNVTVVVRTGKVSVYKKANQSNAQLILTRDQKGIYDGQTKNLTQSELNEREALANTIPQRHSIDFNFDDAPVENIFRTLEEAYGVKMHFDEKTFANCKLTTKLSEESFEERLKIICTAIGATYTIGNNEVSIDGQPCN